MTPEQAYGHPVFVTDVRVLGPTDVGLRGADCWWAQNRLPGRPACVDCSGPVPQWAKNSLCPGTQNPGLGEGLMFETISYGGGSARGFALGGPGDPDIYSTLSAAQQTWVQGALTLLNNKVMQATGTACPGWVDPGVNLAAAVGCFQLWYNTNYGPPKAPGKPLRTDGVVDADTLASIQMIAGLHPADFNVPFPAAPPAPVTPTPAVAKEGLSTGAMVGIGVAGAAVLGGIVWAATRGGGKRRR